MKYFANLKSYYNILFAWDSLFSTYVLQLCESLKRRAGKTVWVF